MSNPLFPVYHFHLLRYTDGQRVDPAERLAATVHLLAFLFVHELGAASDFQKNDDITADALIWMPEYLGLRSYVFIKSYLIISSITRLIKH